MSTCKKVKLITQPNTSKIDSVMDHIIFLRCQNLINQDSGNHWDRDTKSPNSDEAT